MDYSLQTDYDDQFFYIIVGIVMLAFNREDIDKVISHLESLRDEMAMLECGC